LNRDLAFAALKILANKKICRLDQINLQSTSIQQALTSRPICRFEVIQSSRAPNHKIILDIAHNEDAMKALAIRMKTIFPSQSIR
jgi:folylpolyglutamate synthase/dihydropteroate synthase